MNPKNPYERRWGWWYAAIADWMIANPDGSMAQCARDLGKASSTISLIKNTDLFRDYLATRRKEWEARHDYALRAKTTKVALTALDILSEQLEKKRDNVPINTVNAIATSALDRLGYSPQGPTPAAVQVNNYGAGAQVAVMPVNAGALEEARQAIRIAQQKRTAQVAQEVSPPNACTLDLSAQPNTDEPDLDAAAEFPRTLAAD